MTKKRTVLKQIITFFSLILALISNTFLHADIDHNSLFVSINNGTIHKELEIPLLLSIWNRTKTVVGQHHLSFVTMFPVTNKDTLLKRQSLIKALVHQDELRTNMSDALLHIAQTENMFSFYFDTSNPVLSQLDEQGPGTWASKSPFSLSCWFGYKFFRTNWYLFVLLGGKGLFAETLRAKRSYHDNKKTQSNNISVTRGQKNEGFFGACREAWQDVNEYASHFSWKRGLNGSIGELLKQHSPWIVTNDGKPILPEDAIEHGYPRNIYENLIQSFPFFGKHILFKTIPFIAAIGRVWWTDVALYTALSSSIRNIKDQWAHIKILHASCIQFRKFFDGLKALLKVHKDYDLYNSHFEQVKEILKSSVIKEIITLLYTDTFKEEKTGYFFNYGKVLFTHKKIRETIALFKPLLSFVAEYDAYCAIATVFFEQQHTEKPFCFVVFADIHDGALLEANNAWLPLIPKESAVQDVHLGSHFDHAQHMIITGPNWSGKSMYLKMTGLTAYLAQTWGVAPAESCRMTIFDYLETCLDPQGNIQEELSKFAKQKECVFAIQEHIHQCINDKKGLFLIDEIFNGTVDDIIALKTIEFGEAVAGNKNALVQITTHLQEPTILEKSTHGLFKNFHVDIIPQPDGSFARTFKVVQGISTWWFDSNQRELRAKFTDWIDEQLAKKRAKKEKIITQ